MGKMIFVSNLKKRVCLLWMAGLSLTAGQSATIKDTDGSVDNSYKVRIEVQNDRRMYSHNIIGFCGTIDWGDGTTTAYTAPADNPSHSYITGGLFDVICIGKATGLKSHDFRGIDDFGGTVTKDIVKIEHIGKDMGITSMDFAFYGQNKLYHIEDSVFDGLNAVKSFRNVFANCTSLTNVPAGLFDKCTNVTTFAWAFQGCSGLNGAIPEGLFDNCPEVVDFTGIFSDCTGLMGIPEGLFDKCTEVKCFDASFYKCESLNTIPEGLFDNCTKVTTFKHTFRYCRKLAAIPEGLFDNCTDVTSFEYTFAGCRTIMCETPYTTINVDGNDVKVHLYERSLYPEYFTTPDSGWRCFYNCSYISDYGKAVDKGWIL